MAMETKVIFTMLINQIGKADSLEEAYELVVDAARAADVDGKEILSYEEFRKKVKKFREKASE
jgi:hypothetical protein